MVKLDIKDNIAFVTLMRPEKQNALSYEMFTALDHIISQLKRNRTVRAVVIKGEGAHFCSGLDIKSVTRSPKSIIKLLFKWLPGNANLAQRVSLGWQSIPVPVIALIQGNCLGGGCHIALGADIRIAQTDAKIAIMEAKWGLCPDMGTSPILHSVISKDQALNLAWHAERISAQKALEIGLVTEVSDNLEHTLNELLTKYTARSPDALAAIKLIYNKAYMPDRRKLLWLETKAQLRLLLNKNTKVAMTQGQQDVPTFKQRKHW